MQNWVRPNGNSACWFIAFGILLISFWHLFGNQLRDKSLLAAVQAKGINLKPPSAISKPRSLFAKSSADSHASEKNFIRENEYEVGFIKGWNYCLLVFCETGDINMRNVRLIDKSKSIYGEGGLNDGFNECIRRIFSRSDIAEGELIEIAKDSYIDASALQAGFIPDLSTPKLIDVPSVLSVYMVYSELGSRSVAFPASLYRSQYSYDWNEALFNFGVRNLELDECHASVGVVSYPKPPFPQPHATSGHEDCIALLKLHLSTHGKIELRNFARETIGGDTLKQLETNLSIGIQVD